VPYTDVGWSPYFPLVSGLVTEIGGLVSHGINVTFSVYHLCPLLYLYYFLTYKNLFGVKCYSTFVLCFYWTCKTGHFILSIIRQSTAYCC